MGPVHSKRTVTKTYTIQLPALYWLHITLIPFLVPRVKKNIKNNFSASLAVYINITSNGDVEGGDTHIGGKPELCSETELHPDKGWLCSQMRTTYQAHTRPGSSET